MTYLEAAEFLKSHDNYLLLTHKRPDGDTIGSAVGLCELLRAMGKTAWLLPSLDATKVFQDYLQGRQAPPDFAPDTVVSVDVASLGLLPANAAPYQGRIDLAIDHHPSNEFFAQETCLEADKAACGEIIHAILLELGVTVTKRIAECLYVAISTDTGCFKFSNTTSNTHRTAAALIEAGADVYPINKLFFDTKSFSRLRMEAKLTETMEFYADGTVGVCVMPKRLLAEFSATEDDLDSISGFARSIEGVRIGVMIREVEDGLGKISLRTEAPYDAAKICGLLGGGGHAAAAGASVPGGVEGAKAAILQALRDSGVKL